jgi:hypothetical protein
MSPIRSDSERDRQFQDNTRPGRPRVPVISTLLAILAMMNIVSVVLTLMR